MNVLVIRGRPPYPLDYGASIRTYNLLKQLSEKHEITLLTYSDSDTDIENAVFLKEFCKDVIMVPRNYKKSKINIMLRVGKNCFEKYPYSVAIAQTNLMVREIQKLLNVESFDLVHADTLHISSNLINLQTPPRILTQHNIENVILKRVFEVQTNVVSRVFWRSQWNRLYKFEQKASRLFNRIITVSDNDKLNQEKLSPGIPVDVVPNGVDIDYFERDNKLDIVPEGLVFTGALDWHPNDDGLIYFLSEIFPIILAEKPNLRFTIVGKQPSAGLKSLCAKFKNVILTGRVPDVRPFIHESEIYVVPLRVGGGTRLKIMEALAAEIPIVSTSVGCEGIDVENNKDILVADKPEDFAAQVLRLINNPDQKNKLTIEGKKTVTSKYDWGIIAKRMDDSWRNCVANPYDFSSNSID